MNQEGEDIEGPPMEAQTNTAGVVVVQDQDQ